MKSASAVIQSRCPVCTEPGIDGPAIVGSDLMQGTPGEFHVISCSRCGAGRTLPIVDDADLHVYYSSDYGVHAVPQGGLARLVWGLRQRVRWAMALRGGPLRRFKEQEPGSALDIGCGRGDLGEAVIRRGWTAAGVDPSDAAVQVARERGIDARVGTIHSADLPVDEFDVVTMLHALEHVIDPVGDLRAARAVARPGGRLIVVVPNFDSWQRRRFGSRWFHLDVPRHRTHFTSDSLRLACEAAGWTDVAVGDGFDPGALLGSLQYRLVGRLALASGWRLWAWQLASVLLAPVTWCLNRLAGDGDLLYATARRPAGE